MDGTCAKLADGDTNRCTTIQKASRNLVSEQDQWALTVQVRGMRAYSQNKSRGESHGIPFGYNKNLVEPEFQVVQT